MIGVYCYYKNDKPVYVGASIDIDRRRRQHKTAGRFLDCEFKVLEETTNAELFDKERYYIIEWNMCQEGLNKVIHNNMDIPEVREANAERMRQSNPMKPGMTNNGSFKKGHKPIFTEERNKKISQKLMGNKNGVTTHLNSDRLTCEVCGATMNRGNFIRWNHGPKCTQKLST
jgi:hypothetical protein